MLDTLQAKKLATLLSSSLQDMSDRIPEADAADVMDYLEHGEYGIAWELLWHLAGDAPLMFLIEAGQMMGFDVSRRSDD